MKRVSAVDSAWLLIESRDTPMHVGALLEFTKPEGAEPDYLSTQVERMREERRIPRPWNLRPASAPILGPRLPFMHEETDIDLSYHVRHLALPKPGGQRELGVLISRLHSHQLDMHRPLWEVHLIDGLGENGFAIYTKTHHSLLDGVSGMRLLLRTLSPDPDVGETPALWTVGERIKPKEPAAPADSASTESLVNVAAETARSGATALAGLGRAALELGSSRVREGDLAVPYGAPDSALGGRIAGQRRFATQQYDLEELKALAKAAGGTLNDIVLYLSSSSLRRYLKEHGELPARSLTAGVPVSLREADDESTGTNVLIVVTELATNYGDPRERLEAIQNSMAEAKRHMGALSPAAKNSYALLLNAPFITSLVAGLGGIAPVPFNVTVSNVPGPPEPLYFSGGARLDRLSPLSLLPQGTALNITCVSYAGTLNFGLTGARDSLPHLQRLAIYMGEELETLKEILL